MKCRSIQPYSIFIFFIFSFWLLWSLSSLQFVSILVQITMNILVFWTDFPSNIASYVDRMLSERNTTFHWRYVWFATFLLLPILFTLCQQCRVDSGACAPVKKNSHVVVASHSHSTHLMLTHSQQQPDQNGTNCSAILEWQWRDSVACFVCMHVRPSTNFLYSSLQPYCI